MMQQAQPKAQRRVDQALRGSGPLLGQRHSEGSNTRLRHYSIGHPAYGIDALLADLHRFTFLLGVSDGEQLFGELTP